MSRKTFDPVDSVAIANYLNCCHHGQPVPVVRPSSAIRAEPFTLAYLVAERTVFLDHLRNVPNVLVITDLPATELPNATVIASSKPRLDFARTLGRFFMVSKRLGVHSTAMISQKARIGRDVSIGPNVFIEAGVEIGDFVTIGANVVICDGTRIGDRTRVKPNTVIGEDGFGFEYDEEGVPVRIPHLGGVTIGNDVEIGSIVVIARGTLDDTVIEDHAKIDDHVFIAHNVRVGKSSVVIAGAQVSGSVAIGAGAWIGPQSTVRDQVQIGARAFVGIGAVVVGDVPTNTVVAGNPARVLRTRP